MASTDYDAPLADASVLAPNIWRQVGYAATGHPLGVVGAAIVIVFVLAALLADQLTAYDPVTTNAAISLARPSSQRGSA